MSAFGRTSHSRSNTASRPSCVARTMKWPRRSRASQARYCGLGAATVSASTFDMDFELLPQRVEIAVELRRVARRERLVEQHDVRFRAQRARQRHALTHAARELARQVLQELAESVPSEQRGRA